VSSDAWYIQGGYKIGKWVPYFRYERYQGDKQQTSDPLLYQKDKLIGVGYKFTDKVNGRVEYHDINGYGLTDPPGTLGGGTTIDWKMVAAGVNFMF
jgi:hypothetical protein